MFKQTLLLFTALILAPCASSCKTASQSTIDRPKAQSAEIELRFKKHELSNGLKIIFIEDHHAPIVSYQTWFRVGSADDPPGFSGTAHLFEHLMFSGTKKYPAKELFQELEQTGAEFNALTTRDYTLLYENIAPQAIEKIIDIESDRLAGFSVTDEALNRARFIVLEDRRQKNQDRPDLRMEEALWQIAYKRHPYRWPIRGNPYQLLLLDTTRLNQFYKTHFQPSNLTIVVAGDFNSDTVLKLIEKSYGKISSQPAPVRDFVPESPQNEERRLLLSEPDLDFERLLQGYHIVEAQNSNSYVLDVLNGIMFDGTASRLYRRLVSKKKMALSVSGVALTPAYPGLLTIAVVMRKGISSAEAEPEIDQIIRDVQDKGVTQDEVAMAVSQLKAQIYENFRTPYGLGQIMGIVQMILNNPEQVLNDLDSYSKVTSADVQKLAQKYLDPNNRSVVTLAPEKKKK